MVKVIINSVEVEVDPGITILQACEIAGFEIPRFCYHEKLAIAGNCRMCLVEVEGGPPKPVASCAMPVSEGMVVKTNTLKIKKAREGVLEFLLINHPLDCPICDQGGECDLQDQTMKYGCGHSRFTYDKRAVSKKDFGPLIDNMMNRCIHCTRCVRFLSDVAGTYELGAVNRGSDMEITTYISKNINSELSGNIIDLCPVGALTSKPYAFKARPWELSHCDTIDVLDAVGSNIRVDYRGFEIMRVLPRTNEEINEEWISDKTRFAYDGLQLQRLEYPYVRKDGKLVPVNWDEALSFIAKKINGVPGNKIAAIAGDLADCESMVLLKELMHKLKCYNLDCRQDGARISTVSRGHYLFNTSITGIEKSDLCLLINTNPRVEAAILNARLRKRYLNGDFTIAAVADPKIEYLYKVEFLGNTPSVLQDILDGNNNFCNKLIAAKNPMLIVGQEALTHDDADSILTLAGGIAEKYNMIREDWNGFNVLHKAAARVGGLDVGFVPKKNGKDISQILNAANNGEIEIIYLLGADEIDFSLLKSTFVIYQGHHGDLGACNADVVLPSAAYTEKSATYVNTEGRVQRTNISVFPPAQAKEDWIIIKELAHCLGHDLMVEDIKCVRKKLESVNSNFKYLNKIMPSKKWVAINYNINLQNKPFLYKNSNFYMTDVISRSSKIMAKCVKHFNSKV